MNFLSTLPPVAFEVIGITGFGLYVLNYALLTVQKLDTEHVTYFVINLLAASMVLIGLMHTFNLASAMIQTFWIAISIWAIVMRIKRGGKNKQPTAAPGSTLRSTGTQVVRQSVGQHQSDPHWPGGSPRTYHPGLVSDRRMRHRAAG